MKIQEEKLTKNLCKEILYLLNESKEYAYDKNDSLYKKMKTDNFKDSNVDFNFFLEAQRNNQLQVITIRNEKEMLIAHSTFFITSHAQCKDLLTASCQNIAVSSKNRSYENFKKLINFTEEKLKEKKVDTIYVGIDIENEGLHKLMKRFSYDKQEILFKKDL